MAEIKGNPFLEEKKKRLKQVQIIIDSKQPLDYGKLLSLIELNTGVSIEVARGYIKIFEKTDYVEIKNGVVRKPSPSLSVSKEDNKEDR